MNKLEQYYEEYFQIQIPESDRISFNELDDSFKQDLEKSLGFALYKMKDHILEIREEISYQWMMYKRWIREKKFKLLGISRAFDCQSENEGEDKCRTQCSHCKEYYKNLDGFSLKDLNSNQNRP